MSQSTLDIAILPLPNSSDVLTEICRQGARDMLARSIEAEVADWIEFPRPPARRKRPQAGRPQRLSPRAKTA